MFSTTDITIASTALTVGAQLTNLTPDETDERRLIFDFSGLDSSFPMRVLSGDVKVSPIDLLNARDRLLSIIHQYRRVQKGGR